jgi:LemA protein
MEDRWPRNFGADDTIMLTWIILILIVAVIGAVIIVFNRLVHVRQMANEAWSGIDVQLKRRAELVPNLVEVVKGYAAHESRMLEEVTRLRGQAAALSRDDVAQRAQAEGALSIALGKLIALAESYPDLKASTNFLDLQQQLSTLETELQMARRYYNGAVRNQNVLVQSFPSNLIAGAFGFRERQYFELSSEAERAVPQVSLGKRP